MCYGDPYHNTDGEYLRWMEEQERQWHEKKQLEHAYACLEIAHDWLLGKLTDDEASEYLASNNEDWTRLEYWAEEVLKMEDQKDETP
jgi:hypothetical protein